MTINNKDIYYGIFTLFMFDFILVGCSNLNNIISNTLHRGILALTVVCMVLLIIDKYKQVSVKRICVLVGIAVILLVSFWFSREDVLLIEFLLIVPAEGISMKKLTNLVFNSVLSASIIVCTLCKAGLIENSVVNGTRMSLGFYCPNMFAAIGIELICLWSVKRFSKFNKFDAIGILGFAGLINFYSGNKSILIIAAFDVLCIFLFKIEKTINPMKIITYWIATLIVPICALISISFSCLYEKFGFIAILDRFVTNRFFYGRYFFEQYPVTLFGQRVLITSTQSQDLVDFAQPLDNMYVNMLLTYGLVAFLLFCILYHLFIRHLYKKQDYSMVIACCIFAVYAVTETYAFRYGFNFTLMGLATLIPASKKAK